MRHEGDGEGFECDGIDSNTRYAEPQHLWWCIVLGTPLAEAPRPLLFRCAVPCSWLDWPTGVMARPHSLSPMFQGSEVLVAASTPASVGGRSLGSLSSSHQRNKTQYLCWACSAYWAVQQKPVSANMDVCCATDHRTVSDGDSNRPS